MSGSPGATAAWPWSTVEFFHPNPEPSRNRANQTIIGGGLPIGNGETAALSVDDAPGRGRLRAAAWRARGLTMTTAMASDAATMPLGVVSIETYPPIVGGARVRSPTRSTSRTRASPSRRTSAA